MASINFSPFRRLLDIIVGIYVESCFLSFSTARCAEATYRPASVVFNSFVASVNAQTKPLEGLGFITEDIAAVHYPYEGTALTAGQLSLALGFANGIPLYTQTDPCGNTYTGAGYTPLAIRVRKLAQKHMPSSMFSGKLRLYVQAIYGSKRTDYWVNLDANDNYANDQRLFISGRELNPMFYGTCGIYTTADRRYFLMRVASGLISFYPLELSSTAVAFRDLLNTLTPTTALEAMVEAYIFAGATISETASHTVAFTMPTGAPIEYGWKFNRKGDKIRVITHLPDVDDIFHDTFDTTLTIGETGAAGDYDFSVSRSSVAGGRWKSCPAFALWRPDWFIGEGVRVGVYVSGCTLISSEAYIYGYYANDVWVPYKVTFGISDYGAGDIVEQVGAEEMDLATHPSVNLDGCGTDDPTGSGANTVLKTMTGAGYAGTLSALLAGQPISVTLTTSHSLVTTHWFIRQPPAPPSPSEGAYTTSAHPALLESTCDGFNTTEYMKINYQWEDQAPVYSQESSGQFVLPLVPKTGHSYTLQTADVIKSRTYTADAANGGGISIVIPFEEAEGVVFSYNQSFNQFSIATTREETQAITDAKLNIYENEWAYLGFGQFEYVAGGLVNSTDLRQRNGSRAYSQVVTNYDAEHFSNYAAGLFYSVSGQSHYAAAAGDGYELATTEGQVSVMPEWAGKYFKHSVLDPYLYPHPVIRSTYGGANWIYTEETPTYFRNGFPDAHSAVGWV